MLEEEGLNPITSERTSLLTQESQSCRVSSYQQQYQQVQQQTARNISNPPEGSLFEKNLMLDNQTQTRRYMILLLSSIFLLSFLGIIFSNHFSSSSPINPDFFPPLESIGPLGSLEQLELKNERNLTFRWGIAGVGRISDDFAVALSIAGANITAVAAGGLPNPKSRAVSFGQKFGLSSSKCYGSYEELAGDHDVDIVYIGNTNQLHYKTALMMIDRFKHVLVEKPTAMTVQETKHMISAAKSKGVLFTTNYWTRYFPAIKYAQEQMSAGCIGDIVGVRGDFGFQAKADPNDRYFNPVAGGGALLDMGCYLIQFATFAHQSVISYKNYLKSTLSTSQNTPQSESFRSYSDNVDHTSTSPYQFSTMFPDQIMANGLVGNDGVDVETSFLLKWKSQSVGRSLRHKLSTPVGLDMIQSSPNDELNFKGLTGIFSCSLRRGSPFTVEIMGTHGFINIHDPANCPSSSVVNVGTDAYSSSTTGGFQFPVKPICEKNHLGANVFSEPLPFRPPHFGPQNYPGTTGFVYVIRAMENCLLGKGEYQSTATLNNNNKDYYNYCLEMPELSSMEQILIMEIIESIQRETRP